MGWVQWSGVQRPRSLACIVTGTRVQILQWAVHAHGTTACNPVAWVTLSHRPTHTHRCAWDKNVCFHTIPHLQIDLREIHVVDGYPVYVLNCIPREMPQLKYS